ncbi:MAG: hypothetical protein RTU63_12695 [Candidatus Thorarchaeota archaeon]
MQGIDFYLTLLDSGGVIIIVLLISLGIFAGRVKEIYNDIGKGTRYALISYAISGIAMAFASFVSINEDLRFMVTGAGAFFLGAIVVAELWILISENRAKQGTIATSLIIVGVFINNFLEEFANFPLYFMMVGLSILLLGALYFSVVLLRENPSTFSASLLIVLLLYMATWVIGITGWTFENPQYYVVQVIPLIVAATVFSSIRRPWRTSLAVFIELFTFTIGFPILTTAYNAGSWTIFIFVAAEMLTVLCLIAPLNYFLDQAAETGAKTPLYLGGVVAFIALLVSTHSLSWAVFISNGLVWNQYIVWVDVIIGSAAITAFMLAAVSSLYGDWAQTITREVLIVFATAASILTFPLIAEPVGIANDQIWIVLGVVIVIGTLLFFRLTLRIARAGGGRAAGRLMMFVISAIMIAVVSMYSDNIPPVPPDVPIMAILLLLVADVMSVFSNPNFITVAKKHLRIGQTEE